MLALVVSWCHRVILELLWYILFITVDIPDPYVQLTVSTAPEGQKCTSVKDNTHNPVWNETFTFLIDGNIENILGK